MAAFWVLVVVGIWLTARTLRRRAQERRRLAGRPLMSLAQELRWLLVLLVPWGLSVAVGRYAITRHCFRHDVYDAHLAPGATGDAYCSGLLRERFPGTLVAVSTFFLGVALVWTVIVLFVRAWERRRTPVR
jgi:hypothetical protein